MKKSGNIAIGLLLATAALTSNHLSAEESKPTLKPIVLSIIQGRAWVEKYVQQYPEIRWLADSNVRKTQEGQDTLQGTYSEQLYGAKFVEFDRTMMTLHCLRLILDGSDKAYQTFVADQPKEVRLSRGSFEALHRQGQRLLQSKWLGLSELEIAQVMETALVLGDIGKSQIARRVFKEYDIHAPDHDDFYGEAMGIIEKHPELCPSFARLSSSAKLLLVKIANLAHYGHVTHLEGGAGMFSKLRESSIASTDPLALDFDLFIHTCDVAGALGHVNNQSSIMYTELTHRAMQEMGEAVRVLSDPSKTEWDAYNAYLQVRASWLGLNPKDSSERVLARIGAMLRLFTKEEGIVLRRAISELDEPARDRIALQLDAAQKAQGGRTPTYMPAVLVNLSNSSLLGASKEERLSKAITLGLPFIARVLEKHKEMVAKDEIDINIPLNFNETAGVAKTAPLLLTKDFTIDKEGGVHVVSE